MIAVRTRNVSQWAVRLKIIETREMEAVCDSDTRLDVMRELIPREGGVTSSAQAANGLTLAPVIWNAVYCAIDNITERKL
jgi:hypothetical protein